jgi:predicted CopG family antitoxin
VYEQLKAHKRPGESSSDTVERLLEGSEPNWRESVGILSDEEAEELREIVRVRREQHTRDHEERMDELFGQ